MSNVIMLSKNLMQFVFGAGVTFHDIRAAKTFIWAVVGLLLSETIHLNKWALYREGSAQLASKEKQFSRWVHNERIEPMAIFAPLVRALMEQVKDAPIYLALDTSQLWKRFVIVRLALVYRGRALPVGWVVFASKSATVSVVSYQHMLAQVAAQIPCGCHVVLLADRGFLHVKLMRLVRQLGWHFRIRVKLSTKIHRATGKSRSVKQLLPEPGAVRFFNNVLLSNHRFGPVHLVVAYPRTSDGFKKWVIVSSEPTSLDTLAEYEKRFSIEENFLDDKSNGFQLESSQIEDSMGLSRLCLVMATATLYLTSTGTAIVEMGKRSLVDTHLERGLSYFQIGWRWVKRALVFGEKLVGFLWISSGPDPDPSMASKKQFFAPDRWISSLELIDDTPLWREQALQLVRNSIRRVGLAVALVLFHYLHFVVF